MVARHGGPAQRFDILVLTVRGDKARHIIARHLAQDPAVSLEMALSMLGAPPVVYSRGLAAKEAARQQAYLERIGARVKLVAVEQPSAAPEPQSLPASPRPPSSPAAPQPRPVRHVPPPAGHGRSRSTASFGQAPPVRRRRKSDLAKALLALALLAVVATLLFRAQGRRDFRISRTGPLPGGSSSPSRRAPSPHGEDGPTGSRGDASGSRDPVSAEQRDRAAAYADSALASENDWLRAIRFYRIALSFNRYNLEGWHGLINAYRRAGMDTEAEEALGRMRELFGENAPSVAELVEPHGVLADFSDEAGGVCRIEYRPKRNGRDELIHQAYAIVRALAVECGCRTVTLYAATGKGRGLLVRTRTGRLPATVSAFERQASISYAE